MQNSAFRPRITRHHGSQPSPLVCAFKTAGLAPELKVSLGPRLHLSFCACEPAPVLLVSMGSRSHLSFCAGKTSCLDPERRLSIGPSLHLWFCAFKIATLASESLVSMGPSPHLWLLHAIPRHYDQNYKSLLVPDLTYGVLHSKQRL